MAWASDAEDPGYLVQANGYPTSTDQIKEAELLGPTDVPPGFQVRRGTNSTIQGVEEIKRQLAEEQTGKQSPSAVEDSPTTGTSSSEGSRNVVVTTATPSTSGSLPSQTTQVTSQPQDPLEGERGRNTALSPKQGHGPSPEIDL